MCKGERECYRKVWPRGEERLSTEEERRLGERPVEGRCGGRSLVETALVPRGVVDEGDDETGDDAVESVKVSTER